MFRRRTFAISVSEIKKEHCAPFNFKAIFRSKDDPQGYESKQEVTKHRENCFVRKQSFQSELDSQNQHERNQGADEPGCKRLPAIKIHIFSFQNDCPRIAQEESKSCIKILEFRMASGQFA